MRSASRAPGHFQSSKRAKRTSRLILLLYPAGGRPTPDLRTSLRSPHRKCRVGLDRWQGESRWPNDEFRTVDDTGKSRSASENEEGFKIRRPWCANASSQWAPES